MSEQRLIEYRPSFLLFDISNHHFFLFSFSLTLCSGIISTLGDLFCRSLDVSRWLTKYMTSCFLSFYFDNQQLMVEQSWFSFTRWHPCDAITMIHWRWVNSLEIDLSTFNAEDRLNILIRQVDTPDESQAGNLCVCVCVYVCPSVPSVTANKCWQTENITEGLIHLGTSVYVWVLNVSDSSVLRLMLARSGGDTKCW